MNRATKSTLQGLAMLSLCLAALVFASDNRQVTGGNMQSLEPTKPNTRQQ